MAYKPRFYRDWPETPGLVSFNVAVDETDLRVRAERRLEGRVKELIRRFRSDIESYAAARPEFLTSFSPLPIPPTCPPIVREMLRTGQAYDVGPMAAVAGAVAQAVGRELLADSPQCIIENGGDLYVKLNRRARLGLYAGEGSPFSQRLDLVIDCGQSGMGVCASSGTIGHSFSSGKADAVVALAPNAALADAAATAIGNRVHTPDDVARLVEQEQERGILTGLVVAVGKRLGVFGAVELDV